MSVLSKIKLQNTVYDISDTEARNSLSAKYEKPSSGIPNNDLSAAVQASLAKADTALQVAPVSSVNGQTGAVVIDVATDAEDGLMSAEDKEAFDNLAYGLDLVAGENISIIPNSAAGTLTISAADSNITYEAIVDALGYVPADEAEIGNINSVLDRINGEVI